MNSSICGPLYAGAAKADITPKDLTGLTNLWGRSFQGIHDPIFLRALVVENDHHTAALVAADLVEFGDTCAIRERVERETGIPADQIIIAASHDHNAPRVGKVSPGATAKKGGPATDKYTEQVYNQIVEVVRQAKAALQPARMGIGQGRADVNTNRDVFTPQGWQIGTNPYGPSDKTVWVIKFETLTGEPLAILMNYAAHSVVLGPENRLVTGDLAGAAERYVEQCYQDKVVALWTMGAAGNQNPKYMGWDTSYSQSVREDDYILMEAQGHLIGAEVLRVANQIERLTSEVQIEAAMRVVACPAKLPANASENKGMKVKHVETIDLRLGLLLIGQVAITAVSGEVVTNIYQQLKKASPFTNTLMITIANDRVGYIVDDAAYDTPTFAVRATPLQPGYAESVIVNGLLDMMEQYQ